MTVSPPTRHLQGIGSVHAKPAGNLRPGDVTVWNYGYTATVEGIVRETVAQIIVRLIDNTTGDFYDRRMGKTRLVGITAATAARQEAAK
jgi:hypothetical protein